jgi:hypothetical protein
MSTTSTLPGGDGASPLWTFCPPFGLFTSQRCSSRPTSRNHTRPSELRCVEPTVLITCARSNPLQGR